ncbi:syntaxin 6, N-terminal-domain-containing protein [Lipomyces japonicus]|uniref:syntaxin 6, N-terminal-domain-containing protein n=1 Tax=Lipomyces japonicus TaxID=56871 RepID=UPI0034D00B1E
MYNDPYDDLAKEVDQSLSSLIPQSRSFILSQSSRSPATGPSPATATHEQITAILEDLEITLHDLKQSVDAADKSPEQFGLTKDQVEDRRRFVEAREQQVAQIKSQVNDATRGPASTRHGGNKDRINSEFTTINVHDGSNDDDTGGPSEYELQMERQRQQLIMNDQDRQLDSVFGTVQNLREQAAVMGTELEEHVELLQELDQRVDRTQSRIELGMNRVRYVLKKNEEKASNWCIGILTIVLLILLFVVLLA